MKIFNRIKEWVLKEPDSEEFWGLLLLTLIIRVVFPLMLVVFSMFVIGLSIGSLSPDRVELETYNGIFENVAQKFAEAYTTVFKTMFDAGLNFGLKYPVPAFFIKFLLYAVMANVLWVYIVYILRMVRVLFHLINKKLDRWSKK